MFGLDKILTFLWIGLDGELIPANCINPTFHLPRLTGAQAFYRLLIKPQLSNFHFTLFLRVDTNRSFSPRLREVHCEFATCPVSCWKVRLRRRPLLI